MIDWKKYVLVFAGSLVLLILIEQGEALSPINLLLTLILFGVPLSGIVLSNAGMIRQADYPACAYASSAAVGAIYLMTCNPWVSIIGDNIVNIRDATRLLNGLPLLDSQYGIGFKCLLVPPIALFDGSVTAMKVVMASTGVLFPLFGFLVLSRFVSKNRALTIAVLSGLLPVSVTYSNQLIADLPYGAFSFLAMYVTLRYVDRPEVSWPWLIGASCALGWAYHIKSPGLFIAVAAVITMLLRREVVKSALLVVGVSIWVAPWMLFLRSNFGEVGHFSGMLIQIERGEHMPDHEIGDFWHNFFYFIFQKNPQEHLRNLGTVFFPFDFPGEAWLFLILIVVGFFLGRQLVYWKPVSVLKSLEVHDWYVLGYFFVLFTLPGSPDRYLIPVLPFLMLYLFRGFEAVLGILREAFVLRVGFSVLAVGIFLGAYSTDVGIISFKRSQRGYGGYWESYYQAALWVRSHTPQKSRIAARKPSLMWFWSRRESAVFPRTKNKEEALEGLKSSFDYVVVDNLPFFPDKVKYLIPVIEAYPERFAIVHTTPEPKNYVLKMVPVRGGLKSGSP